jgi:hypothetical protein
VPETWNQHSGFFFPMHEREAMYLSFGGDRWNPSAVKVGVGKINAISGLVWDEDLHNDPQDYVVCPYPQLWLDGINAGAEFIRQFVAMPLGRGYTIEHEVTGSEEFGGIQIKFYEAKQGKIPAPMQVKPDTNSAGMPWEAQVSATTEMGLAAGGRIIQRIYPDPYGIDTWNQSKAGSIFIHIVNDEQYRQLTGNEPPPMPISAQLYTELGFPWFELEDELVDLAAPETLRRVKSLKEIDTEKGIVTSSDEGSIEVEESQVKKIRHLGEQEKVDGPKRLG